MSDEELVYALRNFSEGGYTDLAADRIEALTKERGEAMAMARKVSRTTIKYVAGKIAAEAKLAECLERNALLEARLGKAVEALRGSAKQHRIVAGMDLMGASAVAYNAARDAEAKLAEIKGEKP